MTFPPSMVPSPQSLSVMIVDDTAIEGDHSFSVAISDVSALNVNDGMPTSASVSIIDNDGESFLKHSGVVILRIVLYVYLDQKRSRFLM